MIRIKNITSLQLFPLDYAVYLKKDVFKKIFTLKHFFKKTFSLLN